MSRRASIRLIVGGAVVAYFLAFPDGLWAVERLLALTRAVAPGAWGLLIALVLAVAAIRIWGRRPGDAADAVRSGPT